MNYINYNVNIRQQSTLLYDVKDNAKDNMKGNVIKEILTYQYHGPRRHELWSRDNGYDYD